MVLSEGGGMFVIGILYVCMCMKCLFVFVCICRGVSVWCLYICGRG